MELDHLLRSHRWLLVGHRLRRGGGLHGNGVLADHGMVGHITRNDGWMGEFFFYFKINLFIENLFLNLFFWDIL